MIHSDREYHKGKSRLVFAGQESLNGYQQVAVKYERNEVCSTSLGSSPRRLEVRLPDRTLYVTSRADNLNPLLKVRVDAVVSTRRDVNHWKTLHTDMLLFNPIHSPGSLDTRVYIREGIEVLIDSGGFQLVQGTTDFVSPDDTVNFYNKHATIGVGLDFPALPFVDSVLYRENCLLQKLNNDYIRSKLDSHVTLAPVIHGGSPKTREHCLKTVYQSDKVVAVSGMITKRGDDLNAFKQKLSCLALVLDATRKSVLYYHLLGATSPMWLALTSMLANTGYVTSIGGDSVSHRQNAIGGAYNVLPHFHGSTSLTQPVTSDLVAMLPCSCPVCAVAGDARVLRDFRMSELHHAYVANGFKRAIEENVKQYVKGRITRSELLDFITGTKGRAAHLMPNIAFDYFEDVIAKGYAQAKSIAPYEGLSKRGSLFSSSSGMTAEQKSHIERYTRIHKDYEKFHQTKIVGVFK